MQDMRDSGPGPGSEQPPTSGTRPARRGGVWLGTLLIVLGAVFLATSAGWMTWWSWATMWPVLIIALGALLLVGRLW